MKKVFIFLTVLLSAINAIAQSPERMSYQAIIRNGNNDLITGQLVGMQISILQNSTDGTAIYVETQTPTTNANGLVSIKIGEGTVQTGNISAIDWANGPYFIKTEIDPTGSTNYTITGTSQLLSVPYALYSKIGGFNVMKLHDSNELDLVMGTTTGPYVSGSSVNIGDISKYKGLILEWRMYDRPEVFQQFIYLSEYDKDIILGNITTPEYYPRRYTTILSDGAGIMMWLGVSIQGTQLYLSTNSKANPALRLQRVYAIL